MEADIAFPCASGIAGFKGRFSQMSIPAEKVLECAKASGFDAELAVAAVLRGRGWGAASNVYYIDADENISRELDILAHKPFSDTKRVPPVSCWIYICAEVKRTKDPFIFFSDESQFADFGIGYGLLHTKHRVDRFVLPFQKIDEFCPVSGLDRLARSYISFKDGKSQQVRGGIISAFKGAMYQSERDPSRFSDASHDISFFIPLLVVDGPLWEVHHSDKSGDLVAKEVDEIIYYQNYLSPAYDRIQIRVAVVTMEALPKFLERMENWGESIRTALIEGSGKFAG